MFHIRGAVLDRIGSPRPYAESRPISVVDLDLEGPGTDEVLVRIEAGVCHSDLSVVDGNRVRPVPMLLGHEAAGIVEAVGDPKNQGDDTILGQRVVLYGPRRGHCPACATEGLTPCEPGSAANTAGDICRWRDPTRPGRSPGVPPPRRVPASRPMPSSIAPAPFRCRRTYPADAAALLGCAVLTGGGAVLNVGKPRSAAIVVVVGLGGVGMAAVLTAVSHEVCGLGVDQYPKKSAAGGTCGAHDAYTPQQADRTPGSQPTWSSRPSAIRLRSRLRSG